MILIRCKLILLVFSFVPWLQPVGTCFISGHFLPQSLSQDRSFLRRKTKGKDTKERLVWLPKSYTAHFKTFCSTENSLCLQPFQTLELSVFTFRHVIWWFESLHLDIWCHLCHWCPYAPRFQGCGTVGLQLPSLNSRHPSWSEQLVISIAEKVKVIEKRKEELGRKEVNKFIELQIYRDLKQRICCSPDSEINFRSAEQCSTVWPILPLGRSDGPDGPDLAKMIWQKLRRSAGLEVRLMAMLSLEDPQITQITQWTRLSHCSILQSLQSWIQTTRTCSDATVSFCFFLCRIWVGAR